MSEVMTSKQLAAIDKLYQQKYEETLRLRAELEKVKAEQLEHLVIWALKLGLSTGHADTQQDLLIEIGDQITELRNKLEQVKAEYDQALREALSEIEKTIAWLRITEDRAHNEVADVMSITLDKYKHLLKGE